MNPLASSTHTTLNALVVCAKTMEQSQAQATELAAYGKSGRIPFIAVSGIGVGSIGTPQVIAERMRHLEDIGIDLLMLKFTPMLRNFCTSIKSTPASIR